MWMCVFSRDVDVSEVGGRCWCRCEKVSVGVWVLGLCECGCVVLGDIGLWCGFYGYSVNVRVWVCGFLSQVTHLSQCSDLQMSCHSAVTHMCPASLQSISHITRGI